MASNVLWKSHASNPFSVMTTELNSLASTGTATSAAVDNSSDLYTEGDFELVITYGTNPTAGSVIELYLARSVDGGSNYEAVPPAGGVVGAFSLIASTSAQRIIIPNVVLPAGFFKAYVVAKTTGQTAAASGNTLRLMKYTQQVV